MFGKSLWMGLLVLLCFMEPFGLWADTVLLRNGRRLEGRLLGQNRRQITFLIRGRRRKISKRLIRRIRYGLTRAEIARRKKIRGRITRARKVRKRMKARNVKTDKIDLAVANLEKLLKEEEKRQQAELEKRKRLAASISAEISKISLERKNLADKQKKLQEEMKRIRERRNRLAEREKELRERKKAALNRPEKTGTGKAGAGKNAPGKKIAARVEKKNPDRKTAAVRKQPASKQPGTTPTPGAPDWQALWRSGLVPGWGQYHRGRTWQGGALLGGALLSSGAWASAKNAHAAARSDINAVANQGLLLPRDSAYLPLVLMNLQQTQAARSRLSKATGRANLAALFLTGLYLYNLFDASAFSNSRSKGESNREPGSNIGAGPGIYIFQSRTTRKSTETRGVLSLRWNLDW